MKLWFVRIANWIDVHILDHRIEWYCNWVWDLQMSHDIIPDFFGDCPESDKD